MSKSSLGFFKILEAVGGQNRLQKGGASTLLLGLEYTQPVFVGFWSKLVGRFVGFWRKRVGRFVSERVVPVLAPRVGMHHQAKCEKARIPDRGG